jgi:hypothetical protein
MKIRPGRGRSLLGGVMALLVMVLGLAMMGGSGGMGGMGGPLGTFMIIWVLFGLGAAGASFYNAFTRQGLPLYEIDMDHAAEPSFCPRCGKPVGAEDQFCRHCSARLR